MARERILAIDDDGEVRDVYSRLLRAHGYECRVVEDTSCALQIVLNFNPDAIISDKETNSLMSGIDFFEYLIERGLCADSLKYLVSGSELCEAERRKVRDLGLVWLAKPVGIEHIHRIAADLAAPPARAAVAVR